MFGSISNWINTNLPQATANLQQQVQQQVQNVQHAIPPVNIQDFFGKSKATEESQQANVTGTEQNAQEQAAVSATDAAAAAAAPTGVVNQEQPTMQSSTAQHLNKDEIRAAENGSVNLEPTADLEANQQKSSMNSIEIDAQKALGSAKEFGSNIGNMLFSFGKNASSNVMKTATQLKDVIEKTSIIGDFTKENEKFINEKKVQQRREDAAVPPWVGYNQESKLKEEIMDLSTDSRNFLRSPPPGVDFQFDFNLAYPVALATLEEDSNLKEMRFKLVPVKINEESFWRNYFYRVSLIRQSIQLEELNSQANQLYENSKNSGKSEDDSDGSRHSLSTASQHEPINNTNEFVSDSYDHENINVDEIKSDLKQLNLKNEKKDLDDAEWEKEIQDDLENISAEELEKEINQMIGRN